MLTGIYGICDEYEKVAGHDMPKCVKRIGHVTETGISGLGWLDVICLFSVVSELADDDAVGVDHSFAWSKLIPEQALIQSSCTRKLLSDGQSGVMVCQKVCASV